MAENDPFVSVLTPSLNQARWIDDCLTSVYRQTHASIEQIVVDGGSTDGTLELLHEQEGENLRVFERAGTSQAEALNIAFELSRGEIIGWLNTDDAYLGIDTVATAVAAFTAHPEADVIYGDAVMADETGRVLRHVSPDISGLDEAGFVSALVQPAVFFRRRAINGALIADWIDVSIDRELWLRLRQDHSFARVRRILAIDRDYAARKSRTMGDLREADRSRMADRYQLRKPANPALRSFRRWKRRVDGVGELMQIENRYRFAYPAVVDSRWRRFVRQLLLPQRWCRLL